MLQMKTPSPHAFSNSEWHSTIFETFQNWQTYNIHALSMQQLARCESKEGFEPPSKGQTTVQTVQ